LNVVFQKKSQIDCHLEYSELLFKTSLPKPASLKKLRRKWR
jgi:hypothetical protein